MPFKHSRYRSYQKRGPAPQVPNVPLATPNPEYLYVCVQAHREYPKLALHNFKPSTIDAINIGIPGSVVRGRLKEIAFLPASVTPMAKIRRPPAMFKRLHCSSLFGDSLQPFFNGVLLNNFDEEVLFYQELILAMDEEDLIPVHLQDKVVSKFDKVVKMMNMYKTQAASSASESLRQDTLREAQVAANTAIRIAKELCIEVTSHV